MTEMEALLRNLKLNGPHAVDEFVDDAFDLAVQHGTIVLEGLGDVAIRAERTGREYFRLQAKELLSGEHHVSAWLDIKSQWSSQGLMTAVLIHAQTLGFIGNIFRLALDVFGGAGSFVAKAGLETVTNLLKRLG